jgi:hypothetical protein
MDELKAEGARALLFDGRSGFVSLGNAEELQIEGIITMEACIRIEGDIRPGQRIGVHKNIIAHGHDRMTEVPAFAPTFSCE